MGQQDQREAPSSFSGSAPRPRCSPPEPLLWAPHATQQRPKMGALGGPVAATRGPLTTSRPSSRAQQGHPLLTSTPNQPHHPPALSQPEQGPRGFETFTNIKEHDESRPPPPNPTSAIQPVSASAPRLLWRKGSSLKKIPVIWQVPPPYPHPGLTKQTPGAAPGSTALPPLEAIPPTPPHPHRAPPRCRNAGRTRPLWVHGEPPPVSTPTHQQKGHITVTLTERRGSGPLQMSRVRRLEVSFQNRRFPCSVSLVKPPRVNFPFPRMNTENEAVDKRDTRKGRATAPLGDLKEGNDS